MALLIAIVTLGTAAGCRGKQGPSVTPPDVTVAHAKVQNVTDYITFTGNTAATDSVKLVARVEGYLEKLHFTDGARVKKGDLLVTIQQEPYKAQLEQANAQLATAKAALWHAKTEFTRYTGLLKQDAATQTEVDHWRYEREAAEAQVSSADAQVQIAKLNLSYTLVNAPFDGRVGRHLVDPGNLVGAMGQQTPLVEINQVDPMYVYFTIDERDLLRISADPKQRPRQPLPERSIPFYFGLMSEEGFPREGRLDFASISVSPTTGTLQLRGIFPNHDLSLVPGLFVRLRVPTIQRRDALLVPGDAVSFDQQGEYLLVVDDKNVVERRGVKTGAQVGDDLVIDEGLKPDDWVIVEGRLQAIPGREVNPQRATSASPASSRAASNGG
ncbi:MAG TPA: efflux RND transporter periplasmic adaptor subunit [Candidatus Binataceae bacterium]